MQMNLGVAFVVKKTVKFTDICCFSILEHLEKFP
jgi:hypothetical protein